MKILICDDHKIVREGLKQILLQLEEENSILQAASGADVFRILSSEIIDILILDISLPDKNGLEVLQTVKAKWPSTNVLILSMHSQEQYAVRALKYGASGYLTKGAASEELLIAIKKYPLAENIFHNHWPKASHCSLIVISNVRSMICFPLVNLKS
jgi:two-component system invasion response regulator UvrY